MLSAPPWYTMAYSMKRGAHNARAPATKATHVKPPVDSKKLLLQTHSDDSLFENNIKMCKTVTIRII